LGAQHVPRSTRCFENSRSGQAEPVAVTAPFSCVFGHNESELSLQ
jgi:hypothetical protein